MGQIKICLRQWIEAALQFAPHQCEKCGGELHLVWIGSDQEPDLWYICCEVCETEYTILVAYILKEIEEE